MTTWQPIETAPKDGTKILLAVGDSVVVGVWKAEVSGYYETISEKNNKRVQQWVETTTGYWDVDVEDYTPPTHWMPLPEPPK